MHGGTVFSSSVSKLLAEPSPQSSATFSRSVEHLTAREREVFLLLAEGKTPTEVARGLFVSPKTVHTHRQHIMEKLGLRTTTELIRFALREGFSPYRSIAVNALPELPHITDLIEWGSGHDPFSE